MKKFLFISLFFFNSFCFASALSLPQSDLSIPKEVFLKIFEWVVPHILLPTHPKEISSQDVQLKPYQAVCTLWRDVLDQRFDFYSMMKWFVIENGWPYSKCFTYLKIRWDRLESLYCKKNNWFIDQENRRVVFCNNYHDLIMPSDIEDQENTSKKLIGSNQFFKEMKKKLKAYDDDGLFMLQEYMQKRGFLRTYSITRAICAFCVYCEDKNKKALQYNLLQKLAQLYDFTEIFSRLFQRCVFYDEDSYIPQLIGSKVDYRYFLQRMHWSFYQRVIDYENHLSHGYKSAVKEFFKYYQQSFIVKDQKNRSFLYYLLLYSKDAFFKIQMMVLIGFIEGIEQALTDYSESEQIEYKKLFKMNFLERLEGNVLNDAQFLKKYFEEQ